MDLTLNTYSYNKGVDAFQNEDYELAIKYMNMAMEENSWLNFVQAYKVRGFAYSNLNKHNEAIADLNFVEERIKDDFGVYFTRGESYKLIKDYNNAEKDYLTCLKMDYNHYNTNANLYLIYKGKKEWEKAFELINKIIKIRPTPYALTEKEELNTILNPSKNYLLFFDTETTGMPKNWKAPVSDINNWPRLVQFAWQLYDEQGNLIESNSSIIKPDNFIIPRESSRVHGVTTEKAYVEGRNLEAVLDEFRNKLDKTNLLVAHNMSFDEKILGAEFYRLYKSNPLSNIKKLCTMQLSTNICKIDGPYGYKWPKLEELHRFLFKRSFSNAHNAEADIQATADCYFELKRRELI